MLSIDGLVTGIDTTSIIEGLTGIQQRRIDLLQSRRDVEVERQTAFKGVEAGVLSLRSIASRLGRTRGNVFSARAVVSSDDSIATAAASGEAAIGVYSIQVNQLAQAHQLGSDGLSGPSAQITHGVFSLRVGSGETTDIVVDGTNDTLQGLADAVNDADPGVRATIVNDGSTGGAGYRLLVTADRTGESNAITIINNLGDSAAGAVKPDFSGPAIQEAANSSVTLGSGPGAIEIESDTNTVENVISGVTIQLSAADAQKSITLRVDRDTEAATTAIHDFVDSFNDVMKYIDENSAFNAETETAGALLGNRPTQAIQAELQRIVTDTVPDVDPSVNRLSAIGVTLTSAGRLLLNEARLQEVLSGGVDGIQGQDLSKLFAFSGESTNPNIRFVGGSTRTIDGISVQVDITQPATQATATGVNLLAGSTTIDVANDALSVEVDGALASVTLGHGTYTNDELAALVEEALNASPALAGRNVVARVDDGAMAIVSQTYGRASTLSAFAGTALSALGFDGSESGQGQDVVGQFLVDGVSEDAVGRGRLLTGDLENAHTADLQVRVTLSASQLQADAEGTLTLTRGVGSRLDTILGRLVDPVSGRIKTANDEFDKRIEDIDQSIEQQNEIFESRRTQLEAEFVALESAVSQLQSQSSFLAAQLGAVSSGSPGLR